MCTPPAFTSVGRSLLRGKENLVRHGFLGELGVGAVGVLDEGARLLSRRDGMVERRGEQKKEREKEKENRRKKEARHVSSQRRRTNTKDRGNGQGQGSQLVLHVLARQRLAAFAEQRVSHLVLDQPDGADAAPRPEVLPHPLPRRRLVEHGDSPDPQRSVLLQETPRPVSIVVFDPCHTAW